jgi:hypothetical protein
LKLVQDIPLSKDFLTLMEEEEGEKITNVHNRCWVLPLLRKKLCVLHISLIFWKIFILLFISIVCVDYRRIVDVLWNFNTWSMIIFDLHLPIFIPLPSIITFPNSPPSSFIIFYSRFLIWKKTCTTCFLTLTYVS